jgi:hypothetical protein
MFLFQPASPWLSSYLNADDDFLWPSNAIGEVFPISTSPSVEVKMAEGRWCSPKPLALPPLPLRAPPMLPMLPPMLPRTTSCTSAPAGISRSLVAWSRNVPHTIVTKPLSSVAT